MEAQQYFSCLLVAASLINLRWIRYEKMERHSRSSLCEGITNETYFKGLVYGRWFNNLCILFAVIMMIMNYKWWWGLICLFAGYAFFFILKITYETVIPLRLRLLYIQVLVLIVLLLAIIFN